MKRQLIALSGMVLAALAYAETNVTEQVAAVLPSVTVYASRVEAPSATLPCAVRVFDAEAIDASGARDLTELLDKKANVPVRTLNANPLQSHLALRGFGEYSFGRVRVLMDGEDVSGADMEAPNLLRLPLGAVTRVEVLPGPSPVLYGDGAVAGVVNVSTDTRDYARRTRLSARIGSYGSVGATVETRGGLAEEGLLYSGAYDYSRTDGWRDRSGYDLHAFAAGLRQNFANGSSGGVCTHYFNGRYEMPGALTESQWRRDDRQAAHYHDDCRLWSYGFALDAKLRLAEDQWLYCDGAFSQKHRRSHWGDYDAVDDYDSHTFQFTPRYVNEIPFAGHDNKLTLGFDFRHDTYGVDARSPGFAEREDFGRERYALFALDEFFITETLSLTAGARGEAIDNRWRTYRNMCDTHSRDVQGDLELALVYRPVDGLKTYVKGTRFHRSAFCDELNYTADGTFLEPETGWSLDAGAEYAFDAEWQTALTGYWMRMEDEIFFDPQLQRSGYNSNSPDRTERLGFDASVVWKRAKTASAALHCGFVDARFRDGTYDGSSIPLVPQSRVRADAGVWLGDDLELVGGYRFVSSQRLAGDFANAHGKLESCGLIDLAVHYEPSWAEGWKFSVSVDNLLDRSYCDFARWSDYTAAAYYPAAGRTLQATLTWTF